MGFSCRSHLQSNPQAEGRQLRLFRGRRYRHHRLQNGQPFRIANLVGNTQGVAADNGIYVAGWNQHDYFYYVGVSGFNLTLSYLLDLSNTVSQFREWAGQVQQSIVTGKPYYLREMGSVGPNGLPGISETFGNALWTLNFFFLRR